MKFERKGKNKVASKNRRPFDMYIDYFFKRDKNKNPSLYENRKLDMKEFHGRTNAFILLGHSTVLFKLDGRVFITDPVLRDGRVGPLGIGPRNFKYRRKYRVEDMPARIDGVLISHNHYDHLDYSTIRKLDSRVEKYFVPDGVGRLLIKQGVDDGKIVELRWDRTSTFNGLEISFTPTRHFSGRGLFDGNRSLWGSWIVKGSKSLFFSGDTGYWKEFKRIGEEYGSFDVTFIECGAYSKYWPNVHLMPEETLDVGIDLRSNLIVPIHNRKYDLSLHRWDEPLIRFERKAREIEGLKYKIPEIGEVTEY
jgi:L-ascorbate metabolism protein UlaG (beta-lactamase superfamily)